MDEFDEVFSSLCASYGRIGSPKAILAAVSGGADSTALLLALHTLRETYGARIVCAHIDHGLRESAAEDAAFVRHLSAKLDIPCYINKVTVQPSGSVEANAREARYDALRSIAQKEGIGCIATAHHRQDQAETMLMHLMYGTGTGGLSGIREWSNGLWRPFLRVDRNTLMTYLQKQGQTWRTDETNADLSYTRNRIRLKLLPDMEAIYPMFAAKMGETACILADEDKAWHEMAEQWLAVNGFAAHGIYWIDRHAFSGISTALKRRVLLKLGEKAGIKLTFASVEEMLGLDGKEGIQTVNLPGDAKAYCTSGRIHFLTKTNKTCRPEGKIIFSSPAMETGDGCFTQAFDADKIKGAVLRTRMANDTIVPLGQTGTQSLKEYMIDKKIDRPFRSCWPVYAHGSDILWVIGAGVSQRAAIDRTTKHAVFAVYEGVLPDGRKRRGGTP